MATQADVTAFRGQAVNRRDAGYVRYGTSRLTFSDIGQLSEPGGRARCWAGGRRRRPGRGDAAGGPTSPIATLAAWKLGAIVVPVNPMYRAGELTYLLDDAARRCS